MTPMKIAMIAAVAGMCLVVVAGCGNDLAPASLELQAEASATSIHFLGQRIREDRDVVIDSDERLYVVFRGTTEELALRDTGDAYETTFDIDAPVEADESIALQYDAPDGSKTLTAAAPAPFDIGAIPNPSSRSQPIVVSWSPPAGGELDVSIGGVGGPVADNGSFTAPANSIVCASPNCQVDVFIQRLRIGLVDGVDVADFYQFRTQTLNLTP